VHLAQVNIARMRAPLEDPLMAGFVARLDEINALADRSAGFVWGPTPFAFSFKTTFPPDESVAAATDWTQFRPCPAV